MILFRSRQINTIVWGVVSILVCITSVNLAASNRIVLIDKLVLNDVSEQQLLNHSIALDNNHLFISSFTASPHSANILPIHVYQHSLGHGKRSREIAVPDITNVPKANRPEHTLIVKEDFIAVGVAGEFDNSGNLTSRGAIYIYHRNIHGSEKWERIDPITENGLEEVFVLGSPLAVDNNTIVVAAKYKNKFNNFSRSVLIFEKISDSSAKWKIIEKIVGSGIGASDEFGTAVDIKNDIIAIGDTGSNGAAGTVFIFRKISNTPLNWKLEKKISIQNMLITGLGASVSLSDEYLLAGTLSNNAYVFSRDHGGTDNWGSVKLLTPEFDKPLNSGFGSNVILNNKLALVSSHNAKTGDSGQTMGALYLFERDKGGKNNWGLETILKINQRFSQFLKQPIIAISNNYMATLAPADDHHAENRKTPNNTVLVSLYRVLLPADLTVIQSHEGDFIEGEAATYKIDVKNIGEVESRGRITILKILPSGIQYKSAIGRNWQCGAFDNKVACISNAAIGAGETKTVYVQVKIDKNVTRELTNSVSITGGGDTNEENNTMVDTTIVQGQL